MKSLHIGGFKKISGPDHVQTAIEDRLCYAYDATNEAAVPDLIVHPGSPAEVIRIIKLASAEKIPLVPRGAGTGLSGGAIAKRGGIVLHFDRMNRIKKLDPESLTVSVEPGVINWDLKQAVATAGLFYPPDPGSSRFCTLGGNVAENAGGPYGARYGVTGDYVISLEAVLASGEMIRTGSYSRRDVAGYDLTRLLVGSEGTLAVITEITLRLLPKRQARAAAFYSFEDFSPAVGAITALLTSGMSPAALEVMDRITLECLDRYAPGKLPVAGSMLLLEIDGEPSCIEAKLEKVTNIIAAAGGRVVMTAMDEGCEDLWDLRRAVAPALGRITESKIGEDISVPIGKIGVMHEHIMEIGRKHRIDIAVFGHAGDGNLHPNILTDRRDQEKMRRTRGAISDLFYAAIELGGTISGEHGIGFTKAGFMKSARDPVSLRLMQEIKGIFDPEGLLNPGKIFPNDSLSH